MMIPELVEAWRQTRPEEGSVLGKKASLSRARELEPFAAVTEKDSLFGPIRFETYSVFTRSNFTLVRHGETEWNLSGRWQGHADAPLTERGEAQARALGERFKEEFFDACYTSDLGRSMHTTELILGPSGMSFETDERLRERDLGVMQGLTTQEMLERCPDVFDSFRNAGPDFVVPEGESFRQFHERCVEALEDYAERHAGGRVLLVTHGGVLGAILRYVTCIPLEAPRRYVLLNGSVNVVDNIGGHWNMLQWGDVSHLRDMESLDDE